MTVGQGTAVVVRNGSKQVIGPVGRPSGVSEVILESGIAQFREFDPRQVHTRINSLRLLFAHNLTCGKRESVS